MSNYTDRPWIFDMLTAFADWTYAANGAGLDAEEEASSLPHQWNRAYFDLLAHYLPGQTVSAIDTGILRRLHSLPDDSFFDIGADFLRSVDEVYFNSMGLDESVALTIRSSIAQRLTASNSWHWTTQRRESGIGMHIAPIIATCFFNSDDHVRPPRAYLLPRGIDRLPPFLPILEQLAIGAPVHFVAAVVLNLLEVSPRPEHLSFMVAVASDWQRARSESRDFWIDHGFGRRVCALLEAIGSANPRQLVVEPMRSSVSRLLASLVQTGVAEATRLERTLFTGKGLTATEE